MAKDPEPFLSRWSRLKRERDDVEQAPVPVPVTAGEAQTPPDSPPAEAPLPELPPIDDLTPDSDFRPFMDPRVPEALRRLALKKLYADPHFNVQDMLDDYAGDYTLLETLPAGMVGKLVHARRTLLGQGEADRIEAEEREIAEKAAVERAPRQPAEAAAIPQVDERPEQSAENAQSRTPGAPQNRNG
jgi:hypothetical protein